MADTLMLKERLRAYILENFLFSDNPGDLGDDDSFIERQIIDSTGILEVIEFLEDETGLKVEADELLPQNLDSVNRILAFVERKQAA